MRFHQEEVLAIIVDYQERLVPAMMEYETLIQETNKLVKGLQILGIPMMVTQQYTKGLGMSIQQIRDLFGESFAYIDKLTFSVYENDEAKEKIIQSRKKQIIVFGMEAHICVLLTCLELKAAGYEVMVPVDAIRSRKDQDYRYALERMKQEGIYLTTVEAILFELTGTAENPVFKEISKLVK